MRFINDYTPKFLYTSNLLSFYDFVSLLKTLNYYGYFIKQKKLLL